MLCMYGTFFRVATPVFWFYIIGLFINKDFIPSKKKKKKKKKKKTQNERGGGGQEGEGGCE
jgi:hypothetical protein